MSTRRDPGAAVREAVAEGLRSARQSLAPMLLLEALMAAMVGAFYAWPAASAALARFGAWQAQGGLPVAALATGLAGGAISELSLVYLQDRGRWTAAHLENMAFKFGLFLVNGAMVYAFYQVQAALFGTGHGWGTIIPKVLVDQFVFTLVWSLPYQTLLTRWQALRYSARKLRAELNLAFVYDRMLPVLVTNWMFWIPGVILVYALPVPLQSTLFIFATAIWSLLLAAVARQQERRSIPAPPVLHTPAIVTHPGR